MPAKTILLRCVDPRFEGEWALPIQEVVGAHYSFTEFGGVDPLGESGLQILFQKIETLLELDPTIERLIISYHWDCAWCKAQQIGEEVQLRRARRLQMKILQRFHALLSHVAHVGEGGTTTLL
ncbi:MAG: hypothetical protein HYW95_01945 [Candidatus Wildermuthbacteria bacterium]|nr:hypothetical protein [Candidatus Wildermuthbacteria bacterium]